MDMGCDDMPLILTLIVGLFTFLGSLIVFLSKNNKKLVNFSISIGFGVLTSLILFELVPETISLTNNFILVLILIFVGIFLLKILDFFIPDHGEDNSNHLAHIGIMTSIALFIHNFLEGITLYVTFLSSLKMGILLAIGVGLHNIPLGMSISSMFYKDKKKYNTLLISIIVSLSTFLGGLLCFILSLDLIGDFVLGIILSLTLGMLIYIVVFELLAHIYRMKDKKTTIVGTVIGMLLLILSLFIG